jgi:hypothetical protein
MMRTAWPMAAASASAAPPNLCTVTEGSGDLRGRWLFICVLCAICWRKRKRGPSERETARTVQDRVMLHVCRRAASRSGSRPRRRRRHGSGAEHGREVGGARSWIPNVVGGGPVVNDGALRSPTAVADHSTTSRLASGVWRLAEVTVVRMRSHLHQTTRHAVPDARRQTPDAPCHGRRQTPLVPSTTEPSAIRVCPGMPRAPPCSPLRSHRADSGGDVAATRQRRGGEAWHRSPSV